MKTKWPRLIVHGIYIILMINCFGAMASDVKDNNAVIAPEQSMSFEERVMEEPFGPGPEQTKQMLEQIRESDPKKAKELEQLREKNFEAFKMELRKNFNDNFMSQMKKRNAERRKGPQDQTQGPNKPGKEPWSAENWPEMMREQMREKNAEFIKWMKEDYSEEAEKLEQMKGENPEQYMRAMGLGWKKYGKIYMTSKDNPELAAVLKEQLALKEKRMELVRQIRTATDEKKKKELTDNLKEVVNQQFDVIVKHKEITYEGLTKRLTQLQKEVDLRKAEVEKWKDKNFKDERVKQRVDELLNEKEKFEWE